ncbi:unnamed protein product [Pieris brassicae]|uniref:Uncharacterized protein n=1 Tax=Pieris brassicae TaxID=7116 RepID=A0A9P0TWK3_PIEBR|nr:unnamed protein product [Pieris brassicae]
MKRLFVIGLCLAVVLAAPTPDDDDHHDLDDNRPQIDDDDDDDDLQQIDNDDDDDDDQRRQQRHNLRPDDDRNDEQLRNSNLDVLAKELDNLAANPPLVRNVIKKFKEFNESMIDNQLKHYVLQSPGARAHNLGFTPSEVASRVRGLDRQDLRARDDDDDDDDDQL